MDDVDFTNSGRRSKFFETDDDDDDAHRSPPTIADTLDLAVCRPASPGRVSRPLERLSGRWTFRSMPQDVNLTAYGKQFSGEWPSFLAETLETVCDDDDDDATTTPPSAEDFAVFPSAAQTRKLGGSGAGAKGSTAAPKRPNTFVRQCVAYAGRVFTWHFYRTVCRYFLPIATFRNRR
ncbi:uncharacterized protein LOC112599942 [Melanaphis sacchari]|uniref:uncharacterized protein LOC112599942 n=1 Tax=Melanaphis sacchari TaxID=742174 RepID=UPI000DC13FAD|nr:uncharacterized protein LOC112599942 [Melanaphis sacchari]